ncbi:MAG: hypothetical protein M1812_001951 [Candelaria pacifica]|nr:MAG: hypothetical protein M1812_001951 [Candelaria pacifica]
MPPRIIKPRIPALKIYTNPTTSRRHFAYGRYGTDNADILAGKKCIITGASRGIGAAIAKCFSDAGASCVLVGRNIETLERTAIEIQNSARASSLGEARSGWSAAMDVANREDWERLGKDHREVDILVNAAGVAHSSLFMATKPDLIERVMQTNLMGTTWGCQILSKQMMRRRKGCIINISSLLGVKGGKGSVAYSAAKAGILGSSSRSYIKQLLSVLAGLTRSLAAEIGSAGVRVNAIVPGYIETQMTRGTVFCLPFLFITALYFKPRFTNVHEDMTPEARSLALDAIPMKRFGDAEEVAHAALFLVSNPYANNCVLNLDGGLSAT